MDTSVGRASRRRSARCRSQMSRYATRVESSTTMVIPGSRHRAHTTTGDINTLPEGSFLSLPRARDPVPPVDADHALTWSGLLPRAETTALSR